MGLRETLQAEVSRLEAAHEINRVAYRKALASEQAASASKRELCEIASVSANELAAAKEALAAVNRTAARQVNGSGSAAAVSATT